MRNLFIEWMSTLINGIDARNLSAVGPRWQSQVGVASGFCQNLHFRINTAKFAATGIRPKFYEKLLAAGIRLRPDLFDEVVEV